MKNLTALSAGVLFGVGLAIAGMTQPAKVIGFLDLFGDWDPSLMFVMIGAIGMYLPLHRLVLGRPAPLYEKRFWLPEYTSIDRPLILGAALFGAGWGMSGYCPGPGLTSLGAGSRMAIVFVVGMLIGMAIFSAMRRKDAA